MLTFRAMGTDVTVTATGDEAAIGFRVGLTFCEAEQRFSRFRKGSELSALNRARGPFVASAPLFDALVRAREYVAMTGGVFDPAIGAALVALGYDRSFSPGVLDRDGPGPRPPDATLLDVSLDARTRTVHRPETMHIDLGGMIKGATLDLAARELPAAGAIDAGGDAVVRGGPWWIDVEDPADASRVVATLALFDGAVATSAGNRRRWKLGDSTAHHLVDPRTKRSAQSDLAQVTVIAARAELADVLAKTVYVLGEDLGRRFLESQPHRGAVLVRHDGRLSFVGDLDVREVRCG